MKSVGWKKACARAGRVWTEEATPEKRPCVDRVKEALELNIDTIAVACPFCTTTLEDAVKVLDVENKIAVTDILELLKEALTLRAGNPGSFTGGMRANETFLSPLMEISSLLGMGQEANTLSRLVDIEEC